MWLVACGVAMGRLYASGAVRLSMVRRPIKHKS
jgi:hypothetical protein